MPQSPPAKTAVDLSVYTMEAVLKSSYRFTKLCFVEIATVSERSAEVTIRTKREGDSAETLLGDFLNDLIDQRLRTIVAEETKGTRDLIMAHALSQTAFLRPDLESADHREDPLGVGAADKAKALSR